MSKEEVKKKMTSKEFFNGLVKQFQAETGIVMGNLNSLYNAQLQDIVQNFANMQAQLNAANNKVVEQAKEIEQLKKVLNPKSLSIPEKIPETTSPSTAEPPISD